MNCSKCIHFKRCLHLGTLLRDGMIEDAESFCGDFEVKTDVVPKSEVDKILDEFIRLMIDSFGVNPYDRMNFDVRDLVELKKKWEVEG